MSVQQVVDLVREDLRGLASMGVELRPVTLKAVPSQGFASPAALVYELDGQDCRLEFWDGNDNRKVAENALVAVLAAVWGMNTTEARHRLDHERSRARR